VVLIIIDQRIGRLRWLCLGRLRNILPLRVVGSRAEQVDLDDIAAVSRVDGRRQLTQPDDARDQQQRYNEHDESHRADADRRRGRLPVGRLKTAIHGRVVQRAVRHRDRSVLKSSTLFFPVSAM
jgi:hypothetical protein